MFFDVHQKIADWIVKNVGRISPHYSEIVEKSKEAKEKISLEKRLNELTESFTQLEKVLCTRDEEILNLKEKYNSLKKENLDIKNKYEKAVDENEILRLKLDCLSKLSEEERNSIFDSLINRLIYRHRASFVLAPNENILLASGQALNELGYDAKKLDGVRFRDLLFPSDAEIFREALTNILNNSNNNSGFDMGVGFLIGSSTEDKQMYLHYSLKAYVVINKDNDSKTSFVKVFIRPEKRDFLSLQDYKKIRLPKKLKSGELRLFIEKLGHIAEEVKDGKNNFVIDISNQPSLRNNLIIGKIGSVLDSNVGSVYLSGLYRAGPELYTALRELERSSGKISREQLSIQAVEYHTQN